MKQWLHRMLALMMALCLLCPAVLAEDEDFDLFEEVDLGDDFWDDETTEAAQPEEEEFFIGEDGAEAIEENLDTLERDPDINPDDLEVNPNLPENVINILLIGVDMRENDINSKKANLLHNDVTMILSINLDDGSVKLTSIQRDLHAPIPGYRGSARINEAYAKGMGRNGDNGENGGAELTMRTVNKNFEMNITKYVVINFYGVATIIEEMGGVDVDVTKGEALAINNYLKKNGRRMTYDTKGNENREPLEVRKEMKTGEKYVLHLDGVQALMYARLRSGMKTGNNDFNRTARQRHLLELLLKQTVPTLNMNRVSALLKLASPYIRTNIDGLSMLQMVIGVMNQGNLVEKVRNGEELLQQHRVPLDKGYSYDTINGASVTTMNATQWKNAVESIHYFIYGEYYPAK